MLSLLIYLCLFLPPILAQRSKWQPCTELNGELRYPCKCMVEVDKDIQLRILMDCDRVVFSGDYPPLPFGAPIVSFTQRWSGHQTLPPQIFASYGLPLRILDFSHNNIRRLPERLLVGVQNNLTSLNLSDNLLGDGLNPIFSTSELHGMGKLDELDLSGNGIRGVEEGLLKGCEVLRTFRLDRNHLDSIPSTSLNGPRTLKVLSLRQNRIERTRPSAFASQKSLEEIDLHGNVISTIDGGTFNGLELLSNLNLGHNRLTRFNSDVFQGAENLEKLDLSENFIVDFPTVALKTFNSLKQLNMSSNMLSIIDSSHLGHLVTLQVLDLSRNHLDKLLPGTFSGLTDLRYLDVGINSLRTIENDAFDGLVNLETLLLRDNNILLIPASALSKLPNVVSIHLGFNRVTALSNEILRSVSDKTTSLVLSRNVIREIPPAVFNHFKNLNHLDLSGNLLNSISADMFSGLEASLEYLSLAHNRILGFTGQQLQFFNMWYLDLSSNQLSEVPANTFDLLPILSHLNLSDNPHIGALSQNLFHHSQELVTLDLSKISLKAIPINLFGRNPKLERIYLQDNGIVEISEGTFKNLRNLTHINLSNNNIVNVRPGAFVNVMSMKYLSLRGNQLNSFKGEFFNTGTGLEIVDLADNQLSYLFPSSFKIHPRLKKIILTNNKFNFFPSELISTLQFLEYVDLSGNSLKIVDELDFARLPRLRMINLSNNNIESVSEMAFHNSTQLQIIDLSNNNIDRLGDRIFEGLIRLEHLKLSENDLTELPEPIFDRSRLHMLENIDLSNNKFEEAPLKALQKQFFFLSTLDLSYNEITDIPAEDSLMVNIKKLDLSYNPLSKKAINNVLNEPKTVRELNLAGTGINNVGQLETPFLQKLNLSDNKIASLSDKTFLRTTLIEVLDLSHNEVKNITSSLKLAWPKLKSLKHLNLSSNPIIAISQDDFQGLTSLESLDVTDLKECTIIQKAVFDNLPDLKALRAYGYPRLGYFDVEGVLKNLLALEKLDIEVKDASVGSDLLHSAMHPRLQELGLRGDRLRTLSSGALAGLKSSAISVRLRDTSLTALPPALLFSLPRSSRITLDVTGSKLTSLQPQLLVALDDRKADLSMFGLGTNPIACDCNARALRRWLTTSGVGDVKCSSPDYLSGFTLLEIGDDELTCDPKRRTTLTSTSVTSKPPRLVHKTSMEPDIIWSVAPTSPKMPESKGSPIIGASIPNNDDTLIIGIVGGVVAFIAILIVAICIVRVKMTSSSYRGGPLANGIPPQWAPNPGSIYGYAGYAATLPPPSMSGAALPHKLQSAPPSVRYMAPMSAAPAPYFVSLPPHDEKIYR